MTIDSINGQQSLVIDGAAKKQTVSASQREAFEQRLNNNSVQPQYLVDQANIALVNGKPAIAAQYLAEAAEQISGNKVNVNVASDYRVKAE